MTDFDDAAALRARLELLEAELRRERAMFAGGPVVVFRWVATDGWPVAYVSENVRELFGVSAEEFLTGRVAYGACVHPDDLVRVAAEVASHAASGAAGFEQDYRIVRADGAVRWLYDYTAIVRDATGAVTHYEGYVLDISARIEAEAAVRERDEQLRRAQNMESLGRLAGGIAHDFNNLLTAVHGYAELATDLVPADSGARYPLDQVRAAVVRAAALTRQLLAFSRGQVLEPRVVDLVAQVAAAQELLRPVLGGQIELVGVVESAPLWVRVDPTQLEQVIVNLLLNARDAMPGGGRIRLTTTRRRLEQPTPAATGDHLPPGDYAVLSVQDEGVGMDAPTVARVFEPFFTTKGSEGTGLGLATVYGVVQQSQGHVVVRSEPGRGSTFQVWLPRVDAGNATPEPAAPARVSRPSAANETVLLVEDDDDIREVLHRGLEARGYTVVAAVDGQDALERLLNMPLPDAMITDLVMPRLGGVALVERMEALGLRVPVLFVSGYSDAPVSLRRAKRFGFLQKPFTGDALARALRALLGHRG